MPDHPNLDELMVELHGYIEHKHDDHTRPGWQEGDGEWRRLLHPSEWEYPPPIFTAEAFLETITRIDALEANQENHADT